MARLPALVLASGAALALSCVALPPPPAPAPAAFRSAASCRECHAEIWEQWNASAHSRCWGNPRIRAASDDFRKEECRACHSPEPVLRMARLEGKPPYRAHHQDESITCVSCHETSHGMASPRAADGSAPCRPHRDARVSSVEACGVCHDTTHQVVQEWRGTVFERKGTTCVSCHMPEAVTEVTRGQPPRPARSHAFPGWRDPGMMQAATRSSFRLEGGKALVDVTNLCGHKFPGEFRSREFHVVVLQFRGEDVVKEDRWVLKRPEKFEIRPDDRLLPEETRTFEAALDPGIDSVEARLVYKDVPGLLDGQGVELARWERTP